MYLSNINVADQFILSHPSLLINNIEIKTRKLLNPTKRIVLSNVSPHIPNYILEQALSNINLKLASSINFIKAGLTEEKYKHILSFRRQVFVIPDKAEQDVIPDSIIIKYEDEQFRIFITTEEKWCKVCKTHLHNETTCSRLEQAKSTIQESHQFRNSDTSPLNEKGNRTVIDEQMAENKNKQIKPQVTTNITKTLVLEENSDQKQTSSKRPHPITPETEITTDLIFADMHDKNMEQINNETCSSIINQPGTSKENELHAKKKKIKLSTKDMLGPIAGNITEQKGYPLSFTNLTILMDMIKGQQDQLQIIQNFTNDIEGFKRMLTENYGLLQNGAMKGRFRRLIQKLEKSTDESNNSDSETDEQYT